MLENGAGIDYLQEVNLTQVDLARDLKKRKAAAQTCLLLEIMFPT
jgi:hypothetical protein